MQQSYDSTIVRKDDEIASLLNSIRQIEAQTQSLAEFEVKLESEVGKRRSAEDTARSTLSELADTNVKKLEIQSELTASKKQVKNMEELLRRKEEEMIESNKKDDVKLKDMARRLVANEKELALRPPITFERLVEKIGVFGHFTSVMHAEKGGETVSWKELEEYIIEAIRRTSSEAADSRVRESETSKNLGLSQAQVLELKQQLKDKTDAVQILDRGYSHFFLLHLLLVVCLFDVFVLFFGQILQLTDMMTFVQS